MFSQIWAPYLYIFWPHLRSPPLLRSFDIYSHCPLFGQIWAHTLIQSKVGKCQSNIDYVNNMHYLKWFGYLLKQLTILNTYYMSPNFDKTYAPL